jgi:hypothetical protein
VSLYFSALSHTIEVNTKESTMQHQEQNYENVKSAKQAQWLKKKAFKQSDNKNKKGWN